MSQASKLPKLPYTMHTDTRTHRTPHTPHTTHTCICKRVWIHILKQGNSITPYSLSSRAHSLTQSHILIPIISVSLGKFQTPVFFCSSTVSSASLWDMRTWKSSCGGLYMIFSYVEWVSDKCERVSELFACVHMCSNFTFDLRSQSSIFPSTSSVVDASLPGFKPT